MSTFNFTSILKRLFNVYQHREHTIVALYLCIIVLFIGILSVDKIRENLFYNIERIISYWDNRWIRRLEHGEWLVTTGKFEEAGRYLSDIDQDFPAKHVKYAWDRERERLLRALGHSYVEMGKKRLAIGTYSRLVEFDPRNFENHYLLAMACKQFSEFEEAKKHFAQVLEIHPTHLPSIRESVSLYFAGGDFASVINIYKKYLNTFYLQELTVGLGDRVVNLSIPVDGQFHNIEARLTQPTGWSGRLTIHTAGFSVEVERVTMDSPLVVGKSGSMTHRIWPNDTPWQIQEMAPVRSGLYRAMGANSSLQMNLPEQPQGINRVSLRVRLFKVFDRELWDKVEKSYQNLLRRGDTQVTRDQIPYGEFDNVDL